MIDTENKKPKNDESDSSNSGGTARTPDKQNILTPESLTSAMKEAIVKDIQNGIFTKEQGKQLLNELSKAIASLTQSNKKVNSK